MSIGENHTCSRRTFLKSKICFIAGTAISGTVIPGINEVFGETVSDDPKEWFKDIYRQMHFDAHFEGFKEIYRNFDAEKAADMVAGTGSQFLSFMAEDGPSYYPTKIGKKHPGLNRDFVGEFTKALKKRGIRCVVYYSPVFYSPDMKCINKPEVQKFMISQMKEITGLYDVDGFFFDGALQPFMMSVCRCDHCRAQFAKEVGGEIPSDDKDPKAFAYRKWANKNMETFIKNLYSGVSETKKNVVILYNHLWVSRYPVMPPKFIPHVCWDTPTPKNGLYAWNFSFEARYLTTIPGITWSCMNTRGHDWMEYSLREPEAFMQECAIMLASGGRTYLSDIPYPSGNPDPAVMKVFKDVNTRTKKLEPYIKGCSSVKEVAVLNSADSIWSKSPLTPHSVWVPDKAYQSVAGAHKALAESHVQFDIINSEMLPDILENIKY